MSGARGLVRRPWAADGGARPDGGVTLVETLVAMSIFSVVMAIFMSAVLSMTTSTSRVNNTADAGDGVRAVFLRLDRQVRYADAINQPSAAPGGRWYVEFRTAQRAGGQPTLCTQWRYDPTTASLQFRTWDDGQTPADSFSTVATRVLPDAGSGSPFAVALAGADHVNQKLTVSVTSGTGTGDSAGRASMTTSFVARNSSITSPSNTAGAAVCPQATRP
ncbi:type II secretion system protein J [Quadrisphaera sp. INWT6]|uniref:PulJ/GspJ family protein n=1 Tax=Quadrisphaera sp. INWT6 TaxID=2596917 RepID=UPI001892038C|nr:prepilin-type N-terminal cleavage/methylation domain-containing protein [Quadrisphaera sp. INWT6]